MSHLFWSFYFTTFHFSLKTEIHADVNKQAVLTNIEKI